MHHKAIELKAYNFIT